MAEVGPTITVTKGLSAAGPVTFLPAVPLTKSVSGLNLEIPLAPVSKSLTAFVAGGLASVGHTAEKAYEFFLADGTVIPVMSAHITQRLNSLMSMELTVFGRLTDMAWAATAVGSLVDMHIVARDRFGGTIATDLLLTAEITNVINEEKVIRIQCLSTLPTVSNNTIAISSILFLQTRNTGRRSLRCPVPWGVQAGDTLTHPSMSDFVVERLSITLTRKYSVIDVTEAV